MAATSASGELDERDDEAVALLVEHFGGHSPRRRDGYVEVTRPGKPARTGGSATVGVLGRGVVKVWTPNWDGLPAGVHALSSLRRMAGVDGPRVHVPGIEPPDGLPLVAPGRRRAAPADPRIRPRCTAPSATTSGCSRAAPRPTRPRSRSRRWPTSGRGWARAVTYTAGPAITPPSGPVGRVRRPDELGRQRHLVVGGAAAARHPRPPHRRRAHGVGVRIG